MLGQDVDDLGLEVRGSIWEVRSILSVFYIGSRIESLLLNFDLLQLLVPLNHVLAVELRFSHAVSHLF